MVVIVLAVVAIAVVSALVFLSRKQRRGTPARIHVDDLAVGAGPAVCAVTGLPTDHFAEVKSRASGFQAWWLLLALLGPIGLIAVVVLAGRRPGVVSGFLPVSDPALERFSRIVDVRRTAMVFTGLSLVFMIGTFVRVGGGEPGPVGHLAAGLVGLGTLVWLGSTLLGAFRFIGLELDASGHWVTVKRAHPDYAAALARHNTGVHARQP